MGYSGSIIDGIRVYNSYGNSGEFLFELPYGFIFEVIESTIFGLTDYFKFG